MSARAQRDRVQYRDERRAALRDAPDDASRGEHDEHGEQDGHGDAGERSLQGDEKRTLALLGIPTLALALATTVVTTYVPVVAQAFVGSTVVVGLIIGAEGLMALWLPLLVGSWSDRLRTRIGGRLPFLLVGSPVLAVGLVALGVAGSTVTVAIAALVFFTGYFLAYEPYRALYPDAVPDEVSGRAQGTQATWRGAGTGLALVGGGLLLGLGRATPFLVAAVVFVVGIGAFCAVVMRRGVPDRPRNDEAGMREAARDLIDLIRREPPLRAFLVANALWELALGALKTFVVLYVSVGLGFSRAVAGLLIGGVAVFVLLASLVFGKLADRFGHVRVMACALPVFGLGLLGPLLSADHVVIAASVPFVAAGGGALMSLPYAILMPLMPEQEHGVLSGYYSFSRGIGTWLGPLLAGLSVTALASVFPATKGYQAMWLPVGAAALVSLLPLRAVAKASSGGDAPDGRVARS
jgi:MFS family permease